MWRPSCLVLTIGLVLAGRVCLGAESAAVNLDYVAQRALERAQKPFHSPRADLPKVLRQENLDYDKYREIEFRHERALWLAEGLPFRVEFFHPGYLYQDRKSTRLNSSHLGISYAVFCLKKKKT